MFVGGQSRNDHQVNRSQCHNFAGWFTHAKWVSGLIFGEQDPFQFFTIDTRNKKFDSFVELAVLQENVSARLIAKGYVAGNGFDSLLPGIVDE
jgi:hypothetical protein